MKTPISTKGQIVLPVELRKRDQILPGQQFEVERLQAGEYVLRKIPRGGQPGLADWLARCPESDWFQPLPSESTADL